VKPDELLVNREAKEIPNLKLKPGTYTLVLHKRGYQDIEKELESHRAPIL